jgi:hypothetical protein
MHANFVCLTHNLMILLEDDIEKKEGIDNAPERERKVERMEGQGIRGGLRGDNDATLHRAQRKVRALVGNFHLHRCALGRRVGQAGQDLRDEVSRVFHTVAHMENRRSGLSGRLRSE